ncbi:hypothetical protein O181_081433 [Austropuccinia psidii MF-1]|uniref:Transcription factor TFIIIC triple barrel domain-containing protein n=1 Tax=Austropuccinia psidii MF-1 TaxID=1389203 RepID=A0A9Q3IHH0_9BASI|nr:hypothetical protein [Austropuccinia psidii MF-1]
MTEDDPQTIKTSSSRNHKSFPFQLPLNSEWEQVQDFETELNQEAEEWSEEVEYLTFDFGTSLGPPSITSFENFQLLGLNSATPFIKLGSQVYRGEYESLVGTELIMTKSLNQQDNQKNNEQSTKPIFKPIGISQNRIRWTPVRLTEIDEIHEVENDSSSPDELTGTDLSIKKKSQFGRRINTSHQGSSSGGPKHEVRHWASQWTKFRPRSKPKMQAVIVKPSTDGNQDDIADSSNNNSQTDIVQHSKQNDQVDIEQSSGGSNQVIIDQPTNKNNPNDIPNENN